jgi:hypothetical protein
MPFQGFPGRLIRTCVAPLCSTIGYRRPHGSLKEPKTGPVFESEATVREPIPAEDPDQDD